MLLPNRFDKSVFSYKCHVAPHIAIILTAANGDNINQTIVWPAGTAKSGGKKNKNDRLLQWDKMLKWKEVCSTMT